MSRKLFTTPLALQDGLVEVSASGGRRWIWAQTCPELECGCRSAVVVASRSGSRDLLLAAASVIRERMEVGLSMQDAEDKIGDDCALFDLDIDTAEARRVKVSRCNPLLHRYPWLTELLGEIDGEVLEQLARLWYRGKGREAPDTAPQPPDRGSAHEHGAGANAERGAKKTGGSASRVTVDNFQRNPLFPRIQRAVAAILAHGMVVTPIDVLIRMELLKPEDVENWRFGRVPYLERVIHCNVTKLGRILRILRMHAHDLKLVPSHTAYVRWGKRGHRSALRFSKTGDPNVEEAYSRHFVWPGKGPFHSPSAKPDPERAAPPKPTSEP